MNPMRICAFDYVPCVMNPKQIDLAEKVFAAIKNKNTYKAAIENNVDFVARPKGDDAIDIFMTDLHYDMDVKNKRTLVKTPFRLTEVPSEFNHKITRVLEKMNTYLVNAYNVKVK